MNCGASEINGPGSGSSADPYIVWVGRNWGIRARLRDRRTGNSENLTGYTGTATLRRSSADEGVPPATATVTVITAASGRYEVTLAADDLVGIAPGRYVMDAVFENDVDDTDRHFAGFFHLLLIRSVTT